MQKGAPDVASPVRWLIFRAKRGADTAEAKNAQEALSTPY
jgi:hypothetical protein